jgi:ketosteroid isomerase-like protein
MSVRHTSLVAGPGEEIVRRAWETINRSESADAAMAAFEELFDPEIEFVNPEDAIERGTRKGKAGMRTALENFFAGAGGGVTIEVEELRERGERVFTVGRLHARGASSGAEALGPPTGTIYTIRDGRILRIEWHYDVDEALARFEQGDAGSDQA